MFETYPSHLIEKTLSKIDKKVKYFNDAARFIEEEKVGKCSINNAN